MTIAAYFDESGTHESSSVYTIAGFASSDEQWLHFAREWNALVEEFGISGVNFSFGDISLSDHKVFSLWGKAKQANFIGRVIGILERRTLQGFSRSLDLAVFNRLVIEPTQSVPLAERSNSAYSYCLAHILRAMEKWLDQRNHTEPIAYFFESGSRCGSERSKMFDAMRPEDKERYRYGSDTALPKSTAQLYAADFIAYESHKYWKNLYFPTKVIPLRRSFEEMLKRLHLDGAFLDEESLLELLKHAQ